MINKLLSDRAVEDINYRHLAAKTEGYSGSDIKLLCKEAAMNPLRELMRKLESLDNSDDMMSDDFKDGKI